MRVAIFFFIALISVAFTAVPDDKKAQLMQALMSCKELNGATDNDVQSLIRHEPPSTKEAKCMFGCTMEKMNIVIGGKINMDQVKECAKEMGAPADAVEIIESKCGTLSHDDPCEASFLIGGCFLSVGKMHGIDMNL